MRLRREEQSLNDAVIRLTSESAYALVAAVEAKDTYTRNHSITVAAIAETLARRMGIESRLLETVRLAALLHDVGKIGVPDAILNKPGPLTAEEFEIVKTHPARAVEILRPIRRLAAARMMILHHHERYDGSGYPAGLRGTRIPIGSRILCVADAVDAMLSPRSYKAAYDVGRVQRELVAGAGRQFDPAVTTVALQWLDEPRQATVPAA